LLEDDARFERAAIVRQKVLLFLLLLFLQCCEIADFEVKFSALIRNIPIPIVFLPSLTILLLLTALVGVDIIILFIAGVGTVVVMTDVEIRLGHLQRLQDGSVRLGWIRQAVCQQAAVPCQVLQVLIVEI
jgi:hypothetical protein